jgi:hypothetical protein
MTCLKNNQIGNEGLSRVIANYERPVYKKIGTNFNGTLSCPFAPRYRDGGALHSVLVRRSSYDVSLHRDFDIGSSLQRNVTSSVGGGSESKDGVPKLRFQTASVMRLRREDDSLAQCPSPDEPGSVASRAH